MKKYLQYRFPRSQSATKRIVGSNNFFFDATLQLAKKMQALELDNNENAAMCAYAYLSRRFGAPINGFKQEFLGEWFITKEDCEYGVCISISNHIVVKVFAPTETAKKYMGEVQPIVDAYYEKLIAYKREKRLKLFLDNGNSLVDFPAEKMNTFEMDNYVELRLYEKAIEGKELEDSEKTQGFIEQLKTVGKECAEEFAKIEASPLYAGENLEDIINWHYAFNEKMEVGQTLIEVANDFIDNLLNEPTFIGNAVMNLVSVYGEKQFEGLDENAEGLLYSNAMENVCLNANMGSIMPDIKNPETFAKCMQLAYDIGGGEFEKGFEYAFAVMPSILAVNPKNLVEGLKNVKVVIDKARKWGDGDLAVGLKRLEKIRKEVNTKSVNMRSPAFSRKKD